MNEWLLVVLVVLSFASAAFLLEVTPKRAPLRLIARRSSSRRRRPRATSRSTCGTEHDLR